MRIDKDQLLFFRKAMDAQMRATVSDVKLQLIDSSHNLMEIQRQNVHYLNMIEYQNRIFEKVRKLKYLKEQFCWRRIRISSKCWLNVTMCGWSRNLVIASNFQ